MGLSLQAYEDHKEIYGYRRITIYPNHFMNTEVNHKYVYRLMKLLVMKVVMHRKRYRYKPHKPKHIAENILNREFQKEYSAIEVLLTDVTEFKYEKDSKSYLIAILNYRENKIGGFKLSKRNNNALVRDTVNQIEYDIIPCIVVVAFSVPHIDSKKCQEAPNSSKYVTCGQVY